MKDLRLMLHRICTVALVFSALLFTAPARARAATTTLENLQTAFNGESNAHNRYLLFAKQADAEGYGQVASLFRAAAQAEQVHAGNHAQVIKKLGAEPAAKIDAVTVKSTRENLQAAIAGETYERDTMYPNFLKQARAEGNRDAIRTLNLAKLAEAEHAKLYRQAAQNLASLKGSAAKEYFVCPTCGLTVSEVSFANCPSCFTYKEKFVRVA